MPKKKEDATLYKQCTKEPLFAMVKNPQTGKVIIVVGNNKVTNHEFNNYEEAEIFVNEKPYELIINTACLFMNFSLEQQKQNNNENKN